MNLKKHIEKCCSAIRIGTNERDMWLYELHVCDQKAHLWLCDTQGLKELRVFHRELDHFLDLLNLFVQAANHLVRGVRNLLHHHQGHQGVHFVG